MLATLRASKSAMERVCTMPETLALEAAPWDQNVRADRTMYKACIYGFWKGGSVERQDNVFSCYLFIVATYEYVLNSRDTLFP